MEARQWLASFRAMHDQYKRGALNPNEKAKYLTMRNELARSIMVSQRQEMPSNVTEGRRALQVAQLFSVELDGQKLMTRELSCLSFSTITPQRYPVGTVLPFTLVVNRAVDPIKGDCVVASETRVGANTRLVCDFKDLKDAALDRIEDAVFESALAKIG